MLAGLIKGLFVIATAFGFGNIIAKKSTKFKQQKVVKAQQQQRKSIRFVPSQDHQKDVHKHFDNDADSTIIRSPG